MRKIYLEERLIHFSFQIMELVDILPFVKSIQTTETNRKN